MLKKVFEEHLRQAARQVLEATRPYVVDELPDAMRFLVVPNCSFDGNPLEGDEEVFPEDSLPSGTTRRPADVHEVVNYLHRRNKVPEWINVLVDSSDEQYSYAVLECCGRFTAMEEHLYYKGSGVPPFGIKVQLPSLEYEREKDGKFSLRSQYPNRGE